MGVNTEMEIQAYTDRDMRHPGVFDSLDSLSRAKVPLGWDRDRMRSERMSLALEYRIFGSFSMARSTMSLRAGGTAGFSSRGGVGVSERCMSAVATVVSPMKGTVPVSIS